MDRSPAGTPHPLPTVERRKTACMVNFAEPLVKISHKRMCRAPAATIVHMGILPSAPGLEQGEDSVAPQAPLKSPVQNPCTALCTWIWDRMLHRRTQLSPLKAPSLLHASPQCLTHLVAEVPALTGIDVLGRSKPGQKGGKKIIEPNFISSNSSLQFPASCSHIALWDKED